MNIKMIVCSKSKNFINKRLSIYFGNKNFTNKMDQFFPGKYDKSIEAFGLIKKQLQAKSLTFLNQVHGIDGHLVKQFNLKDYYLSDYNLNANLSIESFKRDGDLLLTNQLGCAIGVLTADCLPIIFYDLKHHACAIAHAGWRGSLFGIVKRTIEMMKNFFQTDSASLEVYFGPSAKICCYEVKQDFYKQINKHHKQVFLRKEKKFFFDNVKYNYLELIENGVNQRNIYEQYNTCTICDKLYHSYRRDGDLSGRQATVVVLKNFA